jgi:hypothetical protein
MMTSFAFIFGLPPPVVAAGASRLARRGVGTPVFGGIILASFIGIFAIPPLDVVFRTVRERLRPSARPRKELQVPAHAGAGESIEPRASSWPSEHPMSDKRTWDPRSGLSNRLLRMSGKMVAQMKRLLFVFVYVWIFLALFTLHEGILLPGQNFLYAQGLALLNAFVLAKVVYVAEELHVGENLQERPLIYPVLFRSFLFAVILVFFHLIEEIVTGALRGKPVAESLSTVAGGTLKGILATGVIVFVVLIPFFAFREMAKLVGSETMRELLFVRRFRLSPSSTQDAARQQHDAESAETVGPRPLSA